MESGKPFSLSGGGILKTPRHDSCSIELCPQRCSHPAVSKAGQKKGQEWRFPLLLWCTLSACPGQLTRRLIFFNIFLQRQRRKVKENRKDDHMSPSNETRRKLSIYGGREGGGGQPCRPCVSLSLYLRCQDADSEDEMFHTASFFSLVFLFFL